MTNGSRVAATRSARHHHGSLRTDDEERRARLPTARTRPTDPPSLLDTAVAVRARRGGLGVRLVETARTHAAAAGCQWLHVDFEDALREFYLDACGFAPTGAGLLRLR